MKTTNVKYTVIIILSRVSLSASEGLGAGSKAVGAEEAASETNKTEDLRSGSSQKKQKKHKKHKSKKKKRNREKESSSESEAELEGGAKHLQRWDLNGAW